MTMRNNYLIVETEERVPINVSTMYTFIYEIWSKLINSQNGGENFCRLIFTVVKKFF